MFANANQVAFRMLKNGQCEALDVTVQALSVEQGTCSVRTTLPAHYWGTYRPDDTKCSAGQSCEPAMSGYTCLSAIDKLDTVRCGTCGEKVNGVCKAVDLKCKEGYTCSRSGRDFVCVEGTQTKLTDCGECGKKSRSGMRCIKKQEASFRRSASSAMKLCNEPDFICSPQMLGGKFPCIKETSYLKVLRRAKGLHPLNICRWSRYRNRHTLFVTTSETEALKFKPPEKVVFMSYANGVYKDTTVRDGNEDGWIYKHKNERIRSNVNGQSRSAQQAVTLVSKSPKKSTARGFNHFYAWGFPEVFDGSNGRYLNSGVYKGWNTQIQAYVVNADGSGYEMNCEEVRASPIGIDLNHDNKVDRIDGIFRFDLDNRGGGGRTSWTSGLHQPKEF